MSQFYLSHLLKVLCETFSDLIFQQHLFSSVGTFQLMKALFHVRSFPPVFV